MNPELLIEAFEVSRVGANAYLDVVIESTTDAKERWEAVCYRDEMNDYLRSQVLTRLDLAFSRDQKEKVYVQHRMQEASAEIWRWLQEGAHFYVCGDARRMALDVDHTLHRVVEVFARKPRDAGPRRQIHVDAAERSRPAAARDDLGRGSLARGPKALPQVPAGARVGQGQRRMQRGRRRDRRRNGRGRRALRHAPRY